MIDNANTNYRQIQDKTVDTSHGFLQFHVSIQGVGHLGAWGKFKACYRVFWEPGPPQIRTSVEPPEIIARLPTSVIVHATDWHTNRPISGKVIIDNVEVSNTDTPFNYTFNPSGYSAKVTAPNYIDGHIGFNINNKPVIRAEPSIIPIDNQVNVTIYANDRGTQIPLNGKVLTNEVRGLPREIASTNTPFTHTFEPHITGNPRIGVEFSYPNIAVQVPGYDRVLVPIQFTGELPQPPEPIDDGPDPTCLRPTDDGDGC